MVSFFCVRFAVSTISRASSPETAIGFSHITCLPASSAAQVISQWLTFHVHTYTTSMSGSFTMSR